MQLIKDEQILFKALLKHFFILQCKRVPYNAYYLNSIYTADSKVQILTWEEYKRYKNLRQFWYVTKFMTKIPPPKKCKLNINDF